MGLLSRYNKWDYIRIFLSIVISVVGTVYSCQYFCDAIFWFEGLLVLSLIKSDVRERPKVIKHKLLFLIISDILFALFTLLFTQYFMSFIGLAGHDSVSGIGILYPMLINPASLLYRQRYLVELTSLAAVYCFLRACRIPQHISACITPAPFFLLSLINYFVFAFRGHEMLAADIYNVRTALSVASSYCFPVVRPLLCLGAPYLLFIFACTNFKQDRASEANKKWIASIVYGSISILFIFIFIMSISQLVKERLRPQEWGDSGTNLYGTLMNFSLSAATMHVAVPEDYSVCKLDSMIQNAGVDMNDNGSADEASNIIVIMSESYMQTKDLAPQLGVDEDITPFWNSLNENALHGYALSSVVGGGTANSEFELLTGITMAYMPAGVIPYRQYICHDMYSLPRALKNLGYYTEIMHPYIASGWNRPQVYPCLGFDKMMFIDDFEYSDSDLTRDFVSDECAYRNLISEIESAPEGQKTFTMLITMQNHGGYAENYTNFPITDYVDAGDLSSQSSEDANMLNTYFSLIHRSDAALQELIQYLQNQDEKYTLLIYGDHQPGLPEINDYVDNRFQIPYIIWTNYDMDDSLTEQYSTGEPPLTSICYLPVDLMRAAGIKLPAYYQVISSIRDEIPALNNSMCYVRGGENPIDLYGDTQPMTDSDRQALLLYHYIQYNLLFDSNTGDFKDHLLKVVNTT